MLAFHQEKVESSNPMQYIPMVDPRVRYGTDHFIFSSVVSAALSRALRRMQLSRDDYDNAVVLLGRR